MEQITIVDEATCWELLYNYCGLHEIALIDKINVFKKRRIFFPKTDLVKLLCTLIIGSGHLEMKTSLNMYLIII
jgi:hypothetical protein